MKAKLVNESVESIFRGKSKNEVIQAFRNLDNLKGLDLRSFSQIPDDIKEINNKGPIYLSNATHIPHDIKFNNEGNVYLNNLKNMSAGVKFNNKGGVYLNKLTSMLDGVEFNNKGEINLENLTNIPKGTIFNNKGNIYLFSLYDIIKGIEFNNKGYYIVLKNKRFIYNDVTTGLDIYR